MPPKLAAIVAFFEPLEESEKRDNLIAYADQAGRCIPQPGESFTLEDIRKDEECTDTVGLHLRVDAQECIVLRMSLGEHVQTLTRALAAILCEGLEGARLAEVEGLDSAFIQKIVGGELVRIRSQTVYYLHSRLLGILQAYRHQQRQQHA